LARLKTKCPTAKILLLAIFPRGEEATDPARKQNEATNALIKPLADSRKVFYLDIGKKFLKPATLPFSPTCYTFRPKDIRFERTHLPDGEKTIGVNLRR
jgi:hypothetical protein